jgi:hypothetical protein
MTEFTLRVGPHHLAAGFGVLFSYGGIKGQALRCSSALTMGEACLVTVLSAIDVCRRMMVSEASVSRCQIRGRPDPWIRAATEPTR